MHELCITTNLSASDAAAWATFAATLIAAISAGLAVWAAFRVSGQQLRIAEQNRAADLQLARVRSLTLCREILRDAHVAFMAIHSHRSPVERADLFTGMTAAHAALVECLRGNIALEAIGPVVSAKTAMAGMQAVVSQFSMPLSQGTEAAVLPMHNALREARKAVDDLLASASGDRAASTI